MATTKYKHIPNKLRLHRLAMGFDQVQVARILGYKSTSKLSRWENGLTFPDLVNACKLAGLYHVYVEALYWDLFTTIRTEVTAKTDSVLNNGSSENPSPSHVTRS